MERPLKFVINKNLPAISIPRPRRIGPQLFRLMGAARSTRGKRMRTTSARPARAAVRAGENQQINQTNQDEFEPSLNSGVAGSGGEHRGIDADLLPVRAYISRRDRFRTAGPHRPRNEASHCDEFHSRAGPAPSRHNPAPENPPRALAPGNGAQNVERRRQAPSARRLAACRRKNNRRYAARIRAPARPGRRTGQAASRRRRAGGSIVRAAISRRSRRSPNDNIGARLLTMIPMAPLAECAQRKITDLSKRGSPMPGMAISIWPSRKGEGFMLRLCRESPA